MKYNVRQATMLDLLHIAQLAIAYSEEAQGHDNFDFDLTYALENAAQTLLSDDACFILVHKGNELVGFIWGYAKSLPWSRKKLALDVILYVKPEARCTKAAYLLMKEWEAWAKRKGSAEVQISIASGIHEERSISFFKKLGYSYIGQQFRKEC